VFMFWPNHRALRNPIILEAARFASLLVIGYPVYNLFKRASRSPESFAASSFAENSCEWAAGFLLPCIACFLRGWKFQKGLSKTWRRVNFACCAVMWLVNVLATALMASTWDVKNEARAGEPQSHSQAAAVICVPLFAAVVVCALSRLYPVEEDDFRVNAVI
jgi:hypothetical protein